MYKNSLILMVTLKCFKMHMQETKIPSICLKTMELYTVSYRRNSECIRFFYSARTALGIRLESVFLMVALIQKVAARSAADGTATALRFYVKSS